MANSASDYNFPCQVLCTVTMENSKLTRLSVKSSKPMKTNIDFDNMISSQLLNYSKVSLSVDKIVTTTDCIRRLQCLYFITRRSTMNSKVAKISKYCVRYMISPQGAAKCCICYVTTSNVNFLIKKMR